MVAGLVLLGLSFSGQSAQAGGSNTGNVTVRPDHLGSDADEGIGTLPVVIGEDQFSNSAISDLLPVDLLSTNGLPLPYTRIIGTWEDLTAAVVGSSGDGLITVLPVRGNDGRFHFGFHGNMRVQLDLVELRRRALEPLINTGGEFDGGLASVCSEDGCAPVTTLPSTNGLLSYSTLIAGNALQQAPVQFMAVSPSEHSVLIEISLVNDSTLRISQQIK